VAEAAGRGSGTNVSGINRQLFLLEPSTFNMTVTRRLHSLVAG
jgi:hypothetical protein